jgi:hypothetical protein
MCCRGSANLPMDYTAGIARSTKVDIFFKTVDPLVVWE